MVADHFLLEGHVSIAAAIEAGQRVIHQLLIDENKRYDRRLSKLCRLAQNRGIAVSMLPRESIDQIASGNSHGGAVAWAGERRLQHLADLLPGAKPAFIVMLDGIEDPYNFAGSVRALYAAGADGLVLRPRNWTSASAIVGRASAGASERIPLAIAQSPAEAAEFYRQRGLQIAIAAKTGRARSLFQADLKQSLFLLIGGERRGTSRSIEQVADLHLEIPYGQDFSQSLATVSAAAVIAFEVMRQRQQKLTEALS